MTVVDDYGYLYLSRKFFKSDLWTQGRAFSWAEAFLDLLGMAAWGDHDRIIKGRTVRVPRGSMVASERFLQARWGWRSRGRVRRFLETQVNAGRLNRDQKTDLLTVVKYETYQAGRPTNGPQTDQRRTTDGPKRSKGKEEVTTTSTPLSVADAPDVRVVWDAYLAAWGSHRRRAGRKVTSPPRFTDARRAMVRTRLKDYPVEELAEAARGVFLSPYHCGENATRTEYLGLEVALSVNRERNNVETFRDLYRRRRHTEREATIPDGSTNNAGTRRYSALRGEWVPAAEWEAEGQHA